MGKSNKKINSERINALKKKYDAYLEEDRKRKERNEYILEKMDKMRCSTALVQVRQKSSTSDEIGKVSPYHIPTQAFEGVLYNATPSTNKRYLPPETPYMHMDEPLILQQLSKKYILIPKLRYTLNNDNLQEITQNTENNDWKSKYDILEQLKKNEKENTESNADTTYLHKKELNKENCENVPSEKLNAVAEPNIDYYENLNNDSNYYNDKTNVAGEEIRNDYLNGHENQYEAVNETYQHDIGHSEKKQEETKSEFKNMLPVEKKETEKSPHNTAEEKVLNQHEIVYDERDVNQNEYTPEVTYNAEEYYDNSETQNLAINNEPKDNFNLAGENKIQVAEAKDPTNISEQLEYPIEIINSQDFTPQNDLQINEELKMNPNDQWIKTSGDSSNDNNETITLDDNIKEKSDNIFDPIIVTEDTDLAETVGVETFAENNDAYYDDQATENYLYNEEGAAENYNTEYSAPHENYNQEEYTANYEGAQTEPPYVIEKTEDEAALQQYDQNYQQQYNTGYDNVQDYEQGYDQQYSTDQGYGQNEYTGENYNEHAQQDTIQYDNQNDTQQNVEQVLDNEQGYVVEKQNDTIETSSVEKSLNPQPDQQVKAQ
ncbi:hypothetical protein evm_012844 [Chilo suppressalis]|nr:hypothetical protein evm_012844 [Chilo suppressalis]